MNFQDLKNLPNLCGGGDLRSIIYCCDPKHHPCIIRDIALKILGISVEEFIKIKNKVATRYGVDNIDTVCFKSLSYCCSPLKPCTRRMKALAKLGWDLDTYLRF